VDVGCGTGAWVLEVARQYPKTIVSGLDLSPIQPTDDIPINCEFFVGDLNDGLHFDDGSLDLVHSRILMAGVTRTQWPVYLADVYRICKPGTGWAQIIEGGCYLISQSETLPKDTALEIYNGCVQKVFEKGRDLLYSPYHVEDHMRQAGFVDIQVQELRLPCGDWPDDLKMKAIGRRAINTWTSTVEPLVQQMKAFYPDDQQREDFARRVQEDMANSSYHLYVPVICAIGRKPEIPIL